MKTSHYCIKYEGTQSKETKWNDYEKYCLAQAIFHYKCFQLVIVIHRIILYIKHYTKHCNKHEILNKKEEPHQRGYVRYAMFNTVVKYWIDCNHSCP